METINTDNLEITVSIAMDDYHNGYEPAQYDTDHFNACYQMALSDAIANAYPDADINVDVHNRYDGQRPYMVTGTDDTTIDAIMMDIEHIADRVLCVQNGSVPAFWTVEIIDRTGIDDTEPGESPDADAWAVRTAYTPDHASIYHGAVTPDIRLFVWKRDAIRHASETMENRADVTAFVERMIVNRW